MRKEKPVGTRWYEVICLLFSCYQRREAIWPDLLLKRLTLQQLGELTKENGADRRKTD